MNIIKILFYILYIIPYDINLPSWRLAADPSITRICKTNNKRSSTVLQRF